MSVPVSPAPRPALGASRKKDEGGGLATPPWLLFLLLTAMIAVAAYLLLAMKAPAPPAPEPARIAFFADGTDSMPHLAGSSQLDPAYLNPLLAALQSSIGYNLEFHVGVISGANSPARDFVIPPAGENMEDTLKIRGICQATMPEIEEALAVALAGRPSSNTDIVGALQRFSASASGRGWKILIGSDGLQATRPRSIWSASG
jgi:hypothetical protein